MNAASVDLPRNPLKIYIQDIYRARRFAENRYVYQIFGIIFKNVMIHGVVTSVYNNTGSATNFEISDPTASVHVYYDSNKNNSNVPFETMKALCSDFAKIQTYGVENVHVMTKMINSLNDRKQNPITFDEGSYLTVVGDIFLDDMRQIRVVSAYDCKITSADTDVVWLEELRWLYEKFYLWKKDDDNIK